MKLSRKWLNEFVDLPLSEIDDRAFDEAMTVSGSKVELTEDLSAKIKNVKVGRILSLEKHPNSDHMLVAQLDVGGEAPVQICTGASPPTSSCATSIWSEFGCFSSERMRPTFTFLIFALRSSVSSTLEPETVIASSKARSSISLSGRSTNSFSHFLESFISVRLLSQNCCRKRSSFSKIRRRSVILYSPIARRSRPMPKAQPE